MAEWNNLFYNNRNMSLYDIFAKDSDDFVNTYPRRRRSFEDGGRGFWKLVQDENGNKYFERRDDDNSDEELKYEIVDNKYIHIESPELGSLNIEIARIAPLCGQKIQDLDQEALVKAIIEVIKKNKNRR